MKFLGSKTIETKRLVLRSSKMEEQKRLWEILMMPQVRNLYLTSGKKYANDPNHWAWETQEKFYKSKIESSNRNDVFIWSVFLKPEYTNSKKEKVIGQISAQESGKDIAIRDVGWYIDPAYQRNGYATEAAKAMLDYMFKEVKIEKIETAVAIVNKASWKLMETLGLKRKNENIMIKYTFINNEVECYQYEITKEEYLNKSK